MDYPQVTVTEITEERALLISTTAPKAVSLGGGDYNLPAALAEMNVNNLLKCIREHETRVFLLQWEGNKVPRGVEILGHVIAWTQHGRVLDSDAKQFGTYDRLVEFGGGSGREQQMLIYADPPEVLVEV